VNKTLPSVAFALALSLMVSGCGGDSPSDNSEGVRENTSGQENAQLQEQNTLQDQFLPKAIEMNYAEVQLGRMATEKASDPQVKNYAQMLVQQHSQALQRLQTGGVGSGATSNLNSTTASPATANTSTPAGTREGNSASNTSPAGTTDASGIQLSTEHQQTATRLGSLSGAEFDREFINTMVQEHERAIQFMESQTQGTGAGETTDAANQKAGEGGTQPGSDPHAAQPHAGSTGSSDPAVMAREMLPTLQQHLQQAQSLQREIQNKSQQKK
jgi:putative membrane protein